MRKKTYYTEEPPAFAIEQVQEAGTRLTLRENIAREGEKWSADEYRLYKGAMTAEAVAGGFAGLLAEAKALDAKATAEDVRSLRDSLLAATDRTMLLDRIVRALPAPTSGEAGAALMQGLYAAATNAWAAYRQALRDVPQQAGFPYDVEWPGRPDA